jgi:8-oxo-dGTP pyrophosphatase MutT (NUDIX family)
VEDTRIAALHRVLAAERPRLLEETDGMQRAAVAILIRPDPGDLTLLLIERKRSERDPWSGHMAFPGGRREREESDLDAAIRETREEVGIDLLPGGSLLGRLDDVRPSRGGQGIAVAPFVFAVPADTEVLLEEDEVEAAYWIPVGHFVDPASAAEHLQVMPDGRSVPFPGIAYEGHVIWGLTYRMLMQFLEIARAARTEPVS